MNNIENIFATYSKPQRIKSINQPNAWSFRCQKFNRNRPSQQRQLVAQICVAFVAVAVVG